VESIISEDEEEKNLQLQMVIKSNEDCLQLVKNITERKEYMNYFFAQRPKREREYQQLVERENNAKEDSNYYIADIEYANEDNRFDMIAVQRKDHKDYQNLKLAIIEMKYGSKAIGNECGVYDHFMGVKSLSTEAIKDIIEDTETIMKYKKELGLIKANKYVDRGIKINTSEIDFIFFISGITLKHNKTLLKELEKINNDIKTDEEFKNREIKINVKVFCPYMAGNVMFDKDILSIDEFLELTEFIKNRVA